MSTDPKAARKAILADAMHGTETDVPVATSAPAVPVVAPVAPAAPQTDVMALARALAAALNANNTQQTQTLEAILQTQMRLAQNPGGRHSNSDAENPRKSAFNPEGERANPRPGLKCHMYIGQYDDDGKIDAAYPILEDSCTFEEQLLANQLDQGEATIERNDNKKGTAIIQARRDGAGRLNRIIIALPYGWLSKEFQAQLPPLNRMLKEIVAQLQHAAVA